MYIAIRNTKRKFIKNTLLQTKNFVYNYIWILIIFAKIYISYKQKRKFGCDFECSIDRMRHKRRLHSYIYTYIVVKEKSESAIGAYKSWGKSGPRIK